MTRWIKAEDLKREIHAISLEPGRDPARWNCVFWACCLGILPITLMFIEGGIKVVLSATIVFSMPLIAIGVLMCMSLTKMLREDERRAGGRPV